MKILLITDEEVPSLWEFIQPERYKDIDLIISCGDLKAEYLSYIVTMIPAPLFYVHGNHDDKYLKNPPFGCKCIDGDIVKFNGLRILGLGGSKRYNNGVFQFTEKQMKFRIAKLLPKLWLNRGIDVLVTHSAAFELGDDTDMCHIGFKSFVDLLDKYRPKFFFHGHVHLNYGRKPRITKYKDTTIINAFQYYIIEI